MPALFVMILVVAGFVGSYHSPIHIRPKQALVFFAVSQYTLEMTRSCIPRVCNQAALHNANINVCCSPENKTRHRNCEHPAQMTVYRNCSVEAPHLLSLNTLSRDSIWALKWLDRSQRWLRLECEKKRSMQSWRLIVLLLLYIMPMFMAWPQACVPNDGVVLLTTLGYTRGSAQLLLSIPISLHGKVHALYLNCRWNKASSKAQSQIHGFALPHSKLAACLAPTWTKPHRRRNISYQYLAYNPCYLTRGVWGASIRFMASVIVCVWPLFPFNAHSCQTEAPITLLYKTRLGTRSTRRSLQALVHSLARPIRHKKCVATHWTVSSAKRSHARAKESDIYGQKRSAKVHAFVQVNRP